MFDAIIVGSGIAGLNCALRLAEKKMRVCIVTKKRIAVSATNFAQGGIAAVLSQVDNEKKHISDTLAAGAYHNNKAAVKYMVKHGPNAITRLLELGVPFATHKGALLLTREGGHSERRIAFVSDYTGQAIERALVKKARASKMITLMEHAFAADLLIKKRVCYGVRIIRGTVSENLYAPLVILATGGCGQLFSHTTNPAISTGDGLAMAARAGTRFTDLEFVQFHPTAFTYKGKTRFLISEAVRGEGALLKNAKGERFMPRYHRLAELAPRDIVSRAIFAEEKSGQVYLDLRHKNPREVALRFPQIFKKLKEYGFNMARELIPISPAAHYMCGGIRVNLKGETGIKGLYAFGEVAWTGVHGANRLASNSLLEALVFSDRIAQTAHKRPHRKIKCMPLRIQKLSKQEQAIVRHARLELKKVMWRCVGILRTESSLKEAAQKILVLRHAVDRIKEVNQELLECTNMLTAAHLITKAARARKKSLGCHYRKD